MERANIEIVAGSAPILRFRLVVPEDVTAWTTTLYLTDKTDVAVYQQAGQISSLDQSAQLGVFDVPMSKANTLSLGIRTLKYSFWRTNVGAEEPLTSGEFKVTK